jgi:hypothetical protein
MYNIGYFSVIDYDFMGFITINDYVLSTLNALPLLLFVLLIALGMGFVIGMKRVETRAAQGKLEQRTVTLASQLRILIGSTAPMVIIATIFNLYRGYWECLVFTALGMLAYIAVIIVTVTIYISIVSDARIIFYGWIAGLSFVVLALIGADGAGEARNSLKAELDTQVHTKEAAGSTPYLLRQISSGAIVLYPGQKKLGFIPGNEIQYFDSDKKDNRMFDWRSILRTFQP